jgi:Uma2 family endonuclease
MSTVATQEPNPAPGAIASEEERRLMSPGEQEEEFPPMSTQSAVLASILVTRLNMFAFPRELGIAVAEVLLGLFPGVKRRYKPDVAFVSYRAWPKDRPWPHTDPWHVVPELAVEVVSPNDLADELLGKVADYFRAGVKLVWVVYPRQEYVQVYESLSRIRGVSRTESLDCGAVLPEFLLPLGELFLAPNPEANDEPPPPAPGTGAGV